MRARLQRCKPLELSGALIPRGSKMTDIYEFHRKAFARVSAYVILNAERERVATVAIKFPADGAGRLYAYCHVIGFPMKRAFCGGSGYDKGTVAVAAAFAKCLPVLPIPGERTGGLTLEARFAATAIFDALEASGGQFWERLLENAGFIVLQAV